MYSSKKQKVDNPGKLKAAGKWVSNKVGFSKKQRSVEFSKSDEKRVINMPMDIAYFISMHLSNNDLLSCRAVCREALAVMHFPYNDNRSIFQERIKPIFFTINNLCTLSKDMKSRISFIPKDLDVKLKLDGSINRKSLLSINNSDRTANKNPLISKIQTIDMSEVVCDDVNLSQVNIEDFFVWGGQNPFPRLTTIEMPSVSFILQPEQSPWLLSNNMQRNITVSGILSLQVLKCNDIGTENNWLIDGFYDICHLPNLKAIHFTSINKGPTVRLTDLPLLEKISIDSLYVNLKISLSEVPSLKYLIVNGSEVAIDRRADELVLLKRKKQ